MLRKGTPEYLRSDNGSEFIAKHLRAWLSEMDVSTMYITLEASGITDLLNHLTEQWQTNCSTGRYSIRCTKPGYSLLAGFGSTTPPDHTVPWATVHRPRKRICGLYKNRRLSLQKSGPAIGGTSVFTQELNKSVFMLLYLSTERFIYAASGAGMSAERCGKKRAS